MKKVFVTGGSGTVGEAFIKKYRNEYVFYSFSRNEKMQVALKRRYPEVNIILGSVDDKLALHTSIQKIMPDIIVHAAAMKHIDSAEVSPISAVKSNIIGSLNIIDAAHKFEIPTTVGVSTDKAAQPDSNYGQTKALMEKMFLEANSQYSKFPVCRFGNVSHSHGSVIPYWLSLRAQNKPLPLTDPRMNRLIISREASADLVHGAIELSFNNAGPFILSKSMKSVNMKELAQLISDDIVHVGLRPGEKLNETLISTKELKYTFCEGEKIIIRNYENEGNNKLKEEYNSANAEFMGIDEMLMLISDTDNAMSETRLKRKVY